MGVPQEFLLGGTNFLGEQMFVFWPNILVFWPNKFDQNTKSMQGSICSVLIPLQTYMEIMNLVQIKNIIK